MGFYRIGSSSPSQSSSNSYSLIFKNVFSKQKIILNKNFIYKIGPNVTDCSNMFVNCIGLNQPIDIPENVTDCSNMFVNCTNLNQEIYFPENVNNFYGMYMGCINISPSNTIKLPNDFWNKNCKMLFANVKKNVSTENYNYISHPWNDYRKMYFENGMDTWIIPNNITPNQFQNIWGAFNNINICCNIVFPPCINYNTFKSYFCNQRSGATGPNSFFSFGGGYLRENYYSVFTGGLGPTDQWLDYRKMGLACLEWCYDHNQPFYIDLKGIGMLGSSIKVLAGGGGSTYEDSLNYYYVNTRFPNGLDIIINGLNTTPGGFLNYAKGFFGNIYFTNPYLYYNTQDGSYLNWGYQRWSWYNFFSTNRMRIDNGRRINVFICNNDLILNGLNSGTYGWANFSDSLSNNVSASSFSRNSTCIWSTNLNIYIYTNYGNNYIGPYSQSNLIQKKWENYYNTGVIPNI